MFFAFKCTPFILGYSHRTSSSCSSEGDTTNEGGERRESRDIKREAQSSMANTSNIVSMTCIVQFYMGISRFKGIPMS